MDIAAPTGKADKQPVRTVAFMMAIMSIGKVMGILRDSMQASYLGAHTAEGIAFAQASLLPRALLDIMLAAVLAASLIPVFNTYLESKGKKAALDLASLFVSVIFLLTLLVTVVSIFLAEPVYTRFLDDIALSDATRHLGIRLLRIMLPMIILGGLAFSFTAILQSMGEFRIPAAMSVIHNGIILLYYFLLFDRFGVYGLAVVFLLGWVTQGLIQVPFLIKHGFRFRFNLLEAFRSEGLRQMGVLALPVIAASWTGPINLMINVRVAAGLYGGEFGVPAITFAHSLFIVISGVFVLSIAQVIFPKMCRLAAAADKEGMSATLQETVRVLFFLLLPLTLGLMALSQPLVQFIFGRGEFGERAVEITAHALFYYAPGILGFGLQVVLSRTCFALRDGRTPLIAAVVAIAANAILSYVLAPHLEVAGPALGATIGASLGSVVMLVVLTRRGLLIWPKTLVVDLCKMAIIAMLMFGAIYISSGWFVNRPVLLQLLIPTALGIGVYLCFSALLKIKEMTWALQAIRNTFGF